MQYVDVNIVDSVATIAMNRQSACNALDSGLISDLQLAFSDIHQEKRVGAVVLTGKGDHFCSGVDLKAMAEVAEKETIEAQLAWIEVWRELTGLCETILRFPKTVVAAVDGSAIGAGLALALCCDMIVLSDRASFVANAAKRGLIGGLTAPLLSFRFGASIAARMLLTGQPMNAEESMRLGMCCEVVKPDQIWVASSTWAKKCCDAPRESVQATKRILNEDIGESLLNHLTIGAAAAATLCNTESAAEGLKAFVEKRDPNWP